MRQVTGFALIQAETHVIDSPEQLTHRAANYKSLKRRCSAETLAVCISPTMQLYQYRVDGDHLWHM